MIRHLVFWKFKPQAAGRSGKENRMLAQAALQALPEQIPVIRSFLVACIDSADPESCELCLDSTFDSREDLQAYSIHPAHQSVVRLLRQVRSEKRFADFETVDPGSARVL